MATNVAGVTVLYNPDKSIFDNIQTYSNSINKLYVVDNSEIPSIEIGKTLELKFRNVEYIPFKENKGIGRALNVAALRASAEGFDWLLTMDQDSKASDRMVQKLLTITNLIDQDKIGIIAPSYIFDAPDSETQSEIEDVTTVITSGNLLNLNSYVAAGPFREELFIDFVDNEYCLRLKQKGYKVIVNNKVKLYHQLGNLTCHYFFGRRFCTSNHNYIRRYYITRNRLTILRQFKDQFPDYYNSEKYNNFIEVVKLLLFEKDKWRKIRSVFQGYLDYKKNKLGKYGE